MAKASLPQALRKYWYLVLLGLLVVSVLGYVIYHSGKDPAELLREYGYFVILVWTFLEGETIVIIAGWLSGSVDLKPWLIAVCAFCGSFASDQVMFSLGKYKGEAVLSHFPRIARNMDRAARLFKKYDTALILGFRFVYGVRNITPIMLGISGVSHKKFFFLNFIGAGVWAATFTYGGYYAGKAFMHIMEQVGHGIFYVLLALLAVAALLWYFRARHNVRAARRVAAQCQEEAATGKPMSPECLGWWDEKRKKEAQDAQASAQDAATAGEDTEASARDSDVPGREAAVSGREAATSEPEK